MIRNAAIAGAVALGAVGVGAGFVLQQSVLADDASVGGTVDSPDGVDLDGDGVISDDERVTPSAIYFDCPGGAPLGELHDGDRILSVATHDTADGWLAIREPLSPSATVWIAAAQVVPDETVDALPAAPCASGEAVQVAAPEPPGEEDPDETTTSTTTGVPLPPGVTSTTRPPTATTRPPTATTKPNNTTTTASTTTTTTTTSAPAPSITNVLRSHTEIREQFDGGSCGGTNVSTIQASGANTTAMTMSWAAGPQSGSKSMTKSGFVFRADFGPFPKETIASSTATIVITLEATGPGGSATTQTSVLLRNCTIG